MTYRELIIDLLTKYPHMLDKQVEAEMARFDGSVIRTGKVKWIGLDDDGITLCCGSGYKTYHAGTDPVILARRLAKEKAKTKAFNKACEKALRAAASWRTAKVK